MEAVVLSRDSQPFSQQKLNMKPNVLDAYLNRTLALALMYLQVAQCLLQMRWKGTSGRTALVGATT